MIKEMISLQTFALDRPMPITKHQETAWAVAALAFLFAIKITLLAWGGIAFTPDTPAYIEFARRILEEEAWRSAIDSSAPFSPTEFRIIGYPAIIAACMLLAGEYWPWMIVAIQITLSLFASFLSLRLGIALGLGPRFAALAVVMTGTSLRLVHDQAILTDSLNASLLMTILCVLLTRLVQKRDFGFGEGAALGLCLALAFLLREGMLTLAVLLLAPLSARVFIASVGRRWRAALAAILFFIPLMVTAEIYRSWNAARAGDAFITTGAQTVYLMGLTKAARYDATLFDKNGDLDQAARSVLSSYDFFDAVETIGMLSKAGYDPRAIAQMAQARYFQAWLEKPRAMTRMMLSHVRENQLMLAVRPFESVRDALFWATGQRPWPNHSDLRQASRPAAPFNDILYGAILIERLASIFVTLAFLLAPIIFWRRKDALLALAATVALAFYMGFLLIHSLAHLESRYLSPILFLASLFGLLALKAALGSGIGRAISSLWTNQATS